jgi:hypothetical protein
MEFSRRVVLFLAFLTVGAASGGLGSSWAREGRPEDGSIPQCLSKDAAALPVDNERVLRFKKTTANQYFDRAYIEGTVTREFAGDKSHAHFEVRIGPEEGDVIEVVFNRDFGKPDPSIGDHAMACGDYITSIAPTNRYKASPSGAIVHWVHENSRGGPHPDGFVVLRGKELYGYGQRAYPVVRNQQSKTVVENSRQ